MGYSRPDHASRDPDRKEAPRRRRSWDWEPWEARRTGLPKRTDPDVREARQDARLLLMVVRARFAEGTVPFEHIERLAQPAQDERVPVRQRRVAAELLGRVRLAALGRLGRRVP